MGSDMAGRAEASARPALVEIGLVVGAAQSNSPAPVLDVLAMALYIT